jgi:hypothetical protein
LEIQSAHFGNNRSLSIEGVGVLVFTKASIEKFAESNDPALLQSLMDFHSHFADFSQQDAASTHAHMEVLIKHLFKTNQMRTGSLLLDNTDECAKQYRCGTAFVLLSVLASVYGITIDRPIGAPGHCKDIVNGINATDKQFLAKKMCMIGIPEENEAENRIAAKSMIEGTSKSLTLECMRLCAHDTNIYNDTKMLEVAGLKVTKGQKNNGIRSMYNVRADPDLGLP